MRQLIAGNWKMNGRLEDGTAIAAAVRDGAPDIDCDILICPPATLLLPLAAMLSISTVMLGGQDCHAEPSGAHTGELSAAMLRDAGASWVILGHSERRANQSEADAHVHAKVAAAVAARLTPIVCVGETEAQRQAGVALGVVEAQLLASLPRDFNGVVAYEPVWAIGTGRTPTALDVADMHAHIRATLISHLGAGAKSMRILYGGSVKPSNALELLAVPEVGGALVGGASLNPADFLAIAKASHAVAATATAS
jgi:triosephosphate isomerase